MKNEILSRSEAAPMLCFSFSYCLHFLLTICKLSQIALYLIFLILTCCFLFLQHSSLSSRDTIQRESLDWYHNQLMAKIKLEHQRVKVGLASPLPGHSSGKDTAWQTHVLSGLLCLATGSGFCFSCFLMLHVLVGKDCCHWYINQSWSISPIPLPQEYSDRTIRSGSTDSAEPDFSRTACGCARLPSFRKKAVQKESHL